MTWFKALRALPGDRAGALRPLGVGDILDGTISLYRRHFGYFVTLAALVWLPSMALSLLGAALFPNHEALLPKGMETFPMQEWLKFMVALDPTQQIGSAGIAALVSLLTSLGSLLITGLVVSSVARLACGLPAFADASFRVAIRRAISLFVWPILAVILMFVLTVPIGLVFALLMAVVKEPAALFVLLPIVFVAFVWASIKITLTSVAIVVEGLDPWSGLKRSWSLVGGHWWRTFLVCLALGLIGLILGCGPVMLGGWVGMTFGQGLAVAAVQNLLYFAPQILFTPISLIGMTLLYFDLRVRDEGFDLELSARHLTEAPELKAA